jgi:hypothetical protein
MHLKWIKKLKKDKPFETHVQILVYVSQVKFKKKKKKKKHKKCMYDCSYMHFLCFFWPVLALVSLHWAYAGLFWPALAVVAFVGPHGPLWACVGPALAVVGPRWPLWACMWSCS